jgi:hypothetical protein
VVLDVLIVLSFYCNQEINGLLFRYLENSSRKMERTMKLSQRLFAIALVGSTLGLIGLDVRAAQAEEAQVCIAFEDANYKGAGRGLRANQNTPMTTMNDKISSFQIRNPKCHVVVYQDRDFKGASMSWSEDVAFVGNNWNDRISSWKCVCPIID